MELSNLVFLIKTRDNEEQNFRNWLFSESDTLPKEYCTMAEKHFGKLREVIKNNISVIDIYEAKNKKEEIYDVVICDKFPLNKANINNTDVYKPLLCLVLNDILSLFNDRNDNMYFVPINNSNVKDIANKKIWWSGVNYQIKKRV